MRTHKDNLDKHGYYANNDGDNMQPPTKDQADIGLDNVTLDASASDDNKDRTRQEFAQDADINHMLSKFGVAPARGTPTYGEWDDTIDLQTALDATRQAKAAYRRLPRELQEKFGSMEELVTAVENGSLRIKEEEATPAEPASPPIP